MGDVCKKCEHPDHTGKVCHCRCRHPWPQVSMRVTTVRLPEDQAQEMDIVAGVDKVSASELIRDAIEAYIERRRADPEFQQRIRERIAADQKILDRLT